MIPEKYSMNPQTYFYTLHIYLTNMDNIMDNSVPVALSKIDKIIE